MLLHQHTYNNLSNFGHPASSPPTQATTRCRCCWATATAAFQPAQAFAVGSGPYAVAVADLGNGHPDIVTANYGRQHGVGVAGQRRRHLPAGPVLCRGQWPGCGGGGGSAAMAIPTSSPPTKGTTPCRCCWATATAPSSPPRPSPWGMVRMRWRWRTWAMAIPTSSPPTTATTRCRCCWATATAPSSRPVLCRGE